MAGSPVPPPAEGFWALAAAPPSDVEASVRQARPPSTGHRSDRPRAASAAVEHRDLAEYQMAPEDSVPGLHPFVRRRDWAEFTPRPGNSPLPRSRFLTACCTPATA